MRLFRICAFVFMASALYSCRKEPVEVTEVKIIPASAEIRVGESATLQATVLPDNATDKSLVWYAKDSQLAKVDEGVVTALKQGTTFINASANNGKMARCELLCYSGIAFSFDCDVTLSDGTHWACEWSGYANIKN